MENPASALEVLTALKALGVRLASDFGRGYASLTYLKDFPIDELEIDRFFVSGLSTDDGGIVPTFIQSAHAAGIRAVAEGVETEDHRSILLTMGCDLTHGSPTYSPAPERNPTRRTPALQGNVDTLIRDLDTAIGDPANTGLS